MTHRPTALTILDNHCPKAVAFYEANAPYDRSVYETGIASHAVLQAVGEATAAANAELPPERVQEIAAKVGERLIRDGRSFDGKPEPPLTPWRVWVGVGLAVDWLIPHPLQPGGRIYYEHGMAVDEMWNPVPYKSPDAWLRHVADVVRLEAEEGEEYVRGVVEVVDYKSAWPTNADRLDHMQQKIGAVLVEAHYGEGVELVRQSVVNLRTRKTYSRDLWLEDDGGELLAEWRDEIARTVRVAEESEGVARPGGGCDGCPYILQCDEGRDYVERSTGILAGDYAPELAKLYTAAMGAMAESRKRLRQIAAEAPVEIDGYEVGFLPRPKRVLKDSAPGALADEFALYAARDGKVSIEAVRGLLIAMRLGFGALENAAKLLIEDPADRERWLAEQVEIVNDASFRAQKREVPK